MNAPFDKKTHGLWALDEDLGLAELPLVWFHVDCLHQMLDALCHSPRPVGVCLRGQDAVPAVREGLIFINNANITGCYHMKPESKQYIDY